MLIQWSAYVCAVGLGPSIPHTGWNTEEIWFNLQQVYWISLFAVAQRPNLRPNIQWIQGNVFPRNKRLSVELATHDLLVLKYEDKHELPLVLHGLVFS